jgi:hypothetical protein
LVGRSDSPWYPSMKIYRKNLNNNWSEVLQKVMEELQFLSKKKS